MGDDCSGHDARSGRDNLSVSNHNPNPSQHDDRPVTGLSSRRGDDCSGCVVLSGRDNLSVSNHDPPQHNNRPVTGLSPRGGDDRSGTDCNPNQASQSFLKGFKSMEGANDSPSLSIGSSV
jgi:hypothetical protein